MVTPAGDRDIARNALARARTAHARRARAPQTPTRAPRPRAPARTGSVSKLAAPAPSPPCRLDTPRCNSPSRFFGAKSARADPARRPRFLHRRVCLRALARDIRQPRRPAAPASAPGFARGPPASEAGDPVATLARHATSCRLRPARGPRGFPVAAASSKLWGAPCKWRQQDEPRAVPCSSILRRGRAAARENPVAGDTKRMQHI